MDGLARLRHIVDIMRDGPGVQALTCVGAEQLGPIPRRLGARILPNGMERALWGGGNPLHQIGRRGAAKDRLSLRTIVTVAP